MINIIVGSLMIVGTISINILAYFNGPILPDYVDKKERQHFRYDVVPRDVIRQDITKIEKICHDIANDMGIKNLEFYYSNKLGSTMCGATIAVYKKNVLLLTDLVYLDNSTINKYYAKGLDDIEDVILSDDEKKFVIAHELSHIKLKHCEQSDLYTTVCGTIYGGLIIMSKYKWFLKSLLLGCGGFIGHSRYCEKQADLNACKIVGNQGGINLIARFQMLKTKYKANDWTKYFKNQNGDYLDLMHPLASTRLKYITKFNEKN